MKATVVMTTYNGTKYLQAMLDSLRNQSRKIDEVLIFDDCSTDETVQLIQNYIKEYQLQNWKIVLNEINLGWERNFTRAIESANGTVVFPCDQDDIWHLDKIEKMVAAFESNDNILLLISGYHAFSENGGKLVVQQPVSTETADMVSQVVFDEHYYQILRPRCTMAFRKEIVPIFIKLWKPGTPHDALMWVIASLQHRLYLYNDTFIEYRRHDSNASKYISHGYKYKVNEVERTRIVNDWFLKTYKADKKIRDIICSCDKWCEYREKLLIQKKRIYWIKLWKYRNYYLTIKKYFGDFYYSFEK